MQVVSGSESCERKELTMKNDLRISTLEIISGMVKENIITGEDLKQFIGNDDENQPEYIRKEMEAWYKGLGIEVLTGQPFSLKLPYFSKEEIIQAKKDGNMILCVPKGINKTILGQLFHLDNWTLHESLITNTVEAEDFWFITKDELTPQNTDLPGREIKKLYGREGKLGMSLERYLVFVARTRYLYNKLPDTTSYTWLLNGKYDKTAFLVAGFDSEKKLAIHAWLPQFHSPKVGSRYVVIPEHLYV